MNFKECILITHKYTTYNIYLKSVYLKFNLLLLFYYHYPIVNNNKMTIIYYKIPYGLFKDLAISFAIFLDAIVSVSIVEIDCSNAFK